MTSEAHHIDTWKDVCPMRQLYRLNKQTNKQINGSPAGAGPTSIDASRKCSTERVEDMYFVSTLHASCQPLKRLADAFLSTLFRRRFSVDAFR